MTTAASSDAVLDFNPTVGMVVEGPPPDDPETEPWQVTMVFAPRFPGPPIHIHPHQQEGYQVLSACSTSSSTGSGASSGSARA